VANSLQRFAGAVTAITASHRSFTIAGRASVGEEPLPGRNNTALMPWRTAETGAIASADKPNLRGHVARFNLFPHKARADAI